MWLRGQPVPITLTMLKVPLGSVDAGQACCMACRGKLDLHGPAEASPRREIGTCEECGRWHVIDRIPEVAQAIIFLLPTDTTIMLAYLDRYPQN